MISRVAFGTRVWNFPAKMLRVVPPEQLRWSKESKTAKAMSNKENETTTRSSEQGDVMQTVLLTACSSMNALGS